MFLLINENLVELEIITYIRDYSVKAFYIVSMVVD